MSPHPAAEFTDTANAARLADLHAGRIHYVAAWNSWIVWRGGHWMRDERGVRIAEKAKDVGREYLKDAARAKDDARRTALAKWGTASLSAGRIRAMVELARGIDGILLDHTRLDADPWLLCVRNGVIDLRTGMLREADPADLMTMQAPVEWHDDAEAPRFMRSLEEWHPDPDVRDYVQRVVGSALVGEQVDHRFIIHYGPGGNGKGTFVRALLRVLGPYAVTPHLSLLVQQKHGEHDTVKASLFRARLAVASETERRVKLAEASVKNLTGRDTIRCRRLYENEWEFEPSHSLWLQTNYLPEIAGRDEGIWRRIRVVPWTNTFERKNATEDLDEVLATEASGILRWAVQGVQKWMENGLTEPEAVIRATMAYRKAEDVFARFANDIGLVFDPDAEIRRSELNTELDDWSAGEGARIHKKDFKAWLVENGAKESQQRTGPDGKREWWWSGVGISEQATSENRSDTTVSPVSPGLPETFPRSALTRDFTESPVTPVTGPKSYPCEACGGPLFNRPGVTCFSCRKAVEEAA